MNALFAHTLRLFKLATVYIFLFNLIYNLFNALDKFHEFFFLGDGYMYVICSRVMLKKHFEKK